MASSSVSFRISRSAEDLAATIHALSQRLVSMEQRLQALEVQLTNHDRPDPQEVSILENVDRLLHDCRALLELDPEPAAPTPRADVAELTADLQVDDAVAEPDLSALAAEHLDEVQLAA